MHKAIKKYGWENIEHKILFEGLPEDDACAIEIATIKQYKSDNKNFGYNIESGGQCSQLSQETKDKLRQAHLGKKATEDTRRKQHNARMQFLKNNPEYYGVLNENMQNAIDKAAELKRKPVVQYDLDGNVLAVWKSTREAERALGVQHSHIAKCCNKVPKYNTAGGYRWEYAPE
jgi:group I intron endonuclease